MPSEFYPSKMDPRVPAPQDNLKANEVPVPVGEVASDIRYGTLIEKHDPNRGTTTLKGKVRTYRQMQADPTVGGALQGYENILSLVDWKVEVVDKEKTGIPEDQFDDEKAEEYRNFVQSCFDDMVGTSIPDIISSALDMLSMGHSIQVPHFKIRAGYNDILGLRSKYNDGKIGWKNFKALNVDSIDRWLVPDGGGYSDLTGLIQLKVSGGYVTIPRNRFLLYRTTSKGDTIEGESILYSAVSTYLRLQRTLNIEEVSLSRNLEGIPYLEMPSSYLSKNATDDQKSLRDAMIRQVKSVRYNEQTAIVTPSDTNEQGKKLIDIKLLTAGPNVRVDQCRNVAVACEQLIAESVLANFLKLGSGGGSYAMSSSLQDMFVLAMKKYLNNISSVINEEAIPTLLRVNGMDAMYSPCLVHKGLDTDSIGVFVDALMKSIAAGAVVPSKAIQRAVLEKLKVSTEGADDSWDEVEALREKLMQQQQMTQQGTGQDVEDKSSLDEIEATGIELSPEKLSKSKVIYHHDGGFYTYDGQTMQPLKTE